MSPTPSPAPGEHPPSSPNANGSPYTATGARPRNPYGTSFEFRTPSDFAPTRRAPGGIRCATINVRSISDRGRWASVSDIIKAWDLDILALQETWLWKGEAERLAASVYRETGARSYFTTAPGGDNRRGNRRNNRHLGVMLILGEEIARHHQQTDTVEGTAVRVRLRWRRRELHVIAAYIPPAGTNSAIATKTLDEATKWVRDAEPAAADVILLGDLNDCANPAVDRFPAPASAMRPRTKLMRFLNQSEHYVDLWRGKHGGAAGYTFPLRQEDDRPSPARSRLDYIWTSPTLAQLAIGVGTALSQTDLEEDHGMVSAELASQAILPMTRVEPSHQMNQRPARLDVRGVSKAQWRRFTQTTVARFPDALKEMLDAAATEDCLPEDWAGRQESFQLIDKLEKLLLECAEGLQQAQHRRRRRQAIRDADLTNTRLRLFSIKTRWRRDGRRALERLLEERRSALDRAQVPGELRERLERLAAPPADTAPEWEEVTSALNAAMRFLGKAHVQAATKRLQSRIHSAILRRCERFRDNMGVVLRSLKRGPLVPNTRVDRALFVDDEGRTALETEAEPVLARLRAHFEAWFSARNEDLAAAPEWIQRAYLPLPHVSAEWFENLMSPVTLSELDAVRVALPRGKAPGLSGLVNELWIHAGPDCVKALQLLLNECLRREDIPTGWKKGVVVPIPKTAEFTGNLDQLRPITLLESTRKVFSAVMTRRLQQAIEQHPVLRGFNLGFRANRQAADLAFAIQGLCEASHTAGQPIDLLSLDVRRAYDSVSLATLQYSLRRLRVPEGYISLLSTIHATREAQVLTAHGLTQPYSPASGLDQGEINAPTLWLIVYDPLLCLLQESGKGIRLGGLVENTPAMQKIHPGLRSRLDNTVVFGGAYADDLTLTAASRTDLQALADICSDWCKAHDIEINPAKSVHLSYDPATNRHTLGSPIQLGTGARREPVLKLQPVKEPLRVLSMYTVPDGDHAPIYRTCEELVRNHGQSWCRAGP